jgi:hypothetical protein
MTPKQADRLIASRAIVTVHNARWNETIVGRVVSRSRWNIEIDTGNGHVGLFDRGELEIVQ